MAEAERYNPNHEKISTEKDAVERYSGVFESRREVIETLLEASRRTAFGEKNLPKEAPSSYQDYLQVPVISGNDIKQAGDAEFVTFDYVEKIGTDDCDVFHSGGTTSKPKNIIRSNDAEWVEFPKVIDDLMAAHRHPVLIYKEGKGGYYEFINKGLQQYRHLDSEPIESIDDFIISCENSDAPYFMDLVSSFRSVHHEIKTEFGNNPGKFEALKEKILYTDLSGSEVSINELEEWYETFSQIFKGVELIVTYGLSETGEFGVYPYNPGDTELRYKVFDNTFAEVLDADGNPVISEEGRIVISRMMENKGTILPRYETGDLGRLEVDPDGTVVLVNPNRNPEKGMLDIFGYKIFAGDIYDFVEENLGVPFKLSLRTELSESADHLQVDIDIYSEYAEGGDFESEENKILGFLAMNNPVLMEYIGMGKVDVSINLIKEDRSEIKDWALRKQ